MSKQPPPAPTARTIGPCPTIIQISRTPRHWKFTQHLRTTRPPQTVTQIQLDNSRNEKDCDSVVNDLVVSESDSDLVQENKAKKVESPSDMQIEIEAEKQQDLSKVEHEKEVERSVCIDAIQEKVSEVGEDKREIRGIYEGRFYSKRTTPMRVGWLFWV